MSCSGSMGDVEEEDSAKARHEVERGQEEHSASVGLQIVAPS